MDFQLPKPKGYIIYDPETGLYSRGGDFNGWKKNPKIWANIGHLKNHFNLFISSDGKSTQYNRCPYKGHEEVYDIVTNTKLGTVKEYINEIRSRKMKEHAESQAKYAQWRLENAKKEYEKALKDTKDIIEKNEGKPVWE